MPKSTPFLFIMSIEQQIKIKSNVLKKRKKTKNAKRAIEAKREINRIKKSMKYREKKYNISFPKTKEEISYKILGRNVKRFTKRDIEKLKKIRGSELYRFGEANVNGETVKGYKTADISKKAKMANRNRPKEENQTTTHPTNELSTIKPLTPEEVKPIREEKIRKLQEAIDRSTEKEQENRNTFVSSSDQIIVNFLNPSYWNNLTERANNILKEYVANVLSTTTKDELAYAIEASARTGDLSTLRAYWYKLGMSTSLSVYLEPYLGEGELLRDFDEEMDADMEEQMSLSDYEQAMGMFGI